MKTEEEARTCWCPFARVLGHAVTSGQSSVFGPFNRTSINQDGEMTERLNHCDARCIASECMAFQWVPDHILTLPNGMKVVLDKTDEPLVAGGGWYWSGTYARHEDGYLHRRIIEKRWGRIPDGYFADHIDGDPLNNRRGNLRIVTPEQNAANAKSRGGTSMYRGVFENKGTGKWVAQISKAGQRQCLGTFLSEQAAAKAYDDAAKEIHGEFARLNFEPVQNSGRHGFCGLAGKE